MKFEIWHAFVLGAVLSWGVYVPVLHEGQKELGDGKPSAGSIRAFLCVGLAYLLTAVVIPLILLAVNKAGGESFSFARGEEFNGRGVLFALMGGIFGAAGALCIILSIKNGGQPLFIAPLVFAGAPIVNAIISLLWHPPAEGSPDWKFFAGIVLAAVGAFMVLYSKGQLDAKKPAVSQAIHAPSSKGVASSPPG
jgi:uncharacterized membrane protein